MFFIFLWAKNQKSGILRVHILKSTEERFDWMGSKWWIGSSHLTCFKLLAFSYAETGHI